jgi:putative SOS response-associated peptidase YedK
MCGRFAQVIKHKYLKKYIDEIANPEMTIPINFNVSPSQYAGVVFKHDGAIIQDFMQWTLLAAWAKDSSKYKIINTRIESIKEKAYWRGLFQHKRCLIPVTGFYEWHKKTKQPYFIKSNKGDLVFLAGIYDITNYANGSLKATFSILTKDANSQISELHHRMPIILEDNELTTYLTSPDYKEVLIKCDNMSNDNLVMYPVSKAVNKTSNNYPSLIEEVILEENLSLF